MSAAPKLRIRGRKYGWVAFCTQPDGPAAQRSVIVITLQHRRDMASGGDRLDNEASADISKGAICGR
jgi:hypothetical protein